MEDAQACLLAAETHLWNEDFAEARKVAEQARGLGCQEADALRIDALARWWQGDELKSVTELLEKGLARQSARQSESQDSQAVVMAIRGQAIVRFTLAEVTAGIGPKECGKAMTDLTDAIEVFKELGEQRLQALTLLYLSGLHHARGHREALLEAAGAALALFAELGERRAMAYCHQNIALAHAMKGDYKAAFTKAEKALTIIRSNEAAQAQEAAVLCTMSSWHLAQEKLDEALVVAEQALKISHDSKVQGRLRRPLTTLVSTLLELGRSDEAVRVAQESLEWCKSCDDKRGQITALECVFNVNLSIGRSACSCCPHFRLEAFDDALNAGDERLDLISAIQDRRADVKLHLDTHEVYMAKRDTQSAMHHLEDALATVKELDDPKEEVQVLQWMANLHLSQGDHQEALRVTKEVQDIATKTGDQTGEGVALMLSSSAHSINDQGEEAMSAAVHAQEIFSEIGDRPREALAWQTLSQLHISNRQFDVATFSQERSLDIFKILGKKQEIVKSMHEVANLQLKLKQHKEAEKMVLQLGRYSYWNTQHELNRQCLFVEVCLLARANEGADNPRLSGEVADKAFRAATKAVSLANEIDDRRCKGMALYAKSQVTFGTVGAEVSLTTSDEAVRLLRACGSHEARQKESQVLAFQARVMLKLGRAPQAKQLVEQASQLAREFSDWRGFEMALEVLELIEEAQKIQQAQLAQYAAMGTTEGIPQPSFEAVSSAQVMAVAKPKALDAFTMNKKILSMMEDMFATDEEISLDTDVLETGLDSLSSLEFVGRLAKDLKGIHLSPTLLFDFPTIRAIGLHIEEESIAALN